MSKAHPRNVLAESLEHRLLFTVTPDPGSSFATAFNVGDVNGSLILSDSVGPADATDTYRFTMPRTGTFLAKLRATGSAARVELFRETFDSQGTVHETLLNSRVHDPADPASTGDLPTVQLATGVYYLVVSRVGNDAPYDLRMSADYAGDSFARARNTGSATDATFQDFIGLGTTLPLFDTVDIYKFKMDAKGFAEVSFKLDDQTSLAHLDIIRDANGNGAIDPGELLSAGPQGFSHSTAILLAAGTYFARLEIVRGFSNYHFHVNGDFAGTTPVSQRVTGSLDKGKTFNDFISAFANEDDLDQYAFSVNSTRPLHLVFIEAGSGRSLLRVLKDKNNDGIAQPATETVITTGDQSFANILKTIDAGNYFIQVVADASAGTYQLFVEAPPDAAGNTLATAKNLGTINGLTHQGEFLSEADKVDFFKFTTSAAGRVAVQLNIELEDDANLALIRDANNNGTIDPGETLAQSNLPAGKVDSLIKTNLPAATYFLRVTYNGFEGNTKYMLAFHTDYAGGSPASARNVGTLSGSKTLDDWASGPFGGVISDTSDLYKLTLAATKTLTAKLAGVLSGQDLDLELYQDKNNDGQLAASERIAFSKKLNTAAEQITKALAAGTYYIRVVGVNGETNYHLTLSA